MNWPPLILAWSPQGWLKWLFLASESLFYTHVHTTPHTIVLGHALAWLLHPGEWKKRWEKKKEKKGVFDHNRRELNPQPLDWNSTAHTTAPYTCRTVSTIETESNTSTLSIHMADIPTSVLDSTPQINSVSSGKLFRPVCLRREAAGIPHPDSFQWVSVKSPALLRVHVAL